MPAQIPTLAHFFCHSNPYDTSPASRHGSRDIYAPKGIISRAPPRAINLVVPSDGLGMQRAGVSDDDDLWGRKRWKKKTKQSGQ